MTAIEVEKIAAQLDGFGCAVIEGLIEPQACRAIADGYAEEGRYRSRVVMSRHGFGRGEYKYFTDPLPELVAALRAALYPPLAAIANRWNAALGLDARYPAEHGDFLARCHAAGQQCRALVPDARAGLPLDRTERAAGRIGSIAGPDQRHRRVGNESAAVAARADVMGPARVDRRL